MTITGTIKRKNIVQKPRRVDLVLKDDKGVFQFIQVQPKNYIKVLKCDTGDCVEADYIYEGITKVLTDLKIKK